MFTRSYTLILSSTIILFFQFLHIVDARTLALSPRSNPSNIRAVSDPSLLDSVQRRQDSATPTFPSDIPSCPICEQSYGSINSCADAAPVLANFSMVIFNPGAFIDVIKCACTDTFQAAYPQCADCFIRTNQTTFLSANSDELPDIISGIRSICAIESTLLGNVSAANGESSSTSDAAALATASSTLASAAESVHGHYSLGLGSGLDELLAGLVLGFIACFV